MPTLPPPVDHPQFRLLAAKEAERDADRVFAAVFDLHVRPGPGPRQWYVWGRSEPHWVDLGQDTDQPCDCPDHANRNRVCAHMIAAMLEEGRTVKEVSALLRRLTAHRVQRLWERWLADNPQ